MAILDNNIDGRMGMAGTSPADQARADEAIRSMRRSLQGWLKYRGILDDYVAGRRPAPRRWRNPGARPLPPVVVARTLRANRYAIEQDLAETIYALLIESGLSPATLPRPDVRADPDAAVKLAKIALSGRTPTEAQTQTELGIWFLIAIPVVGVILVISQMIKSKAEVAKERARLDCVKTGACTDAGFWLKVGAIAVTAWLAWDKFGLREAVEKRKRKK